MNGCDSHLPQMNVGLAVFTNQGRLNYSMCPVVDSVDTVVGKRAKVPHQMGWMGWMGMDGDGWDGMDGMDESVEAKSV